MIQLPNGFFNNAMTVFINLECGKSSDKRRMPVDSTFRAIYNKGYNIFVDNSAARSFNVNIDSPMFFCFALTQKEAIEKMMQSNFSYKHLPIKSITNH